MMKDSVTLTQFAAEMARLRQEIEQMNQRLDMIYGVVTRLAETRAQPQPFTAAAPKRPADLSSTAEMPFSAQALLDPGSMLASLHQHAVKAGLTIPIEAVERLQEEFPVEAVADGNA